jgi:uncharacterized protein YkwD
MALALLRRRPVRHVAAVILCACLLSAEPSPPVWAATSIGPPEELASRVIELTNAERARAGLPPLGASPELAAAAQAYAEVLASGDCFAHTCGPVPQVQERGELAGYTEWRALGENLAGGQQTPERVIQMWMESPSHRQNILDPTFTEIGIGVATGGRYGICWIQNFGTR